MIPSRKILALLLVVTLICWSQKGFSQNTENYNQVISEIIEELSSQTDVEVDYSTFVDELNELVENPIDLNTANADDLSRIFFLSTFQIQSLLSYRDSTGNFLSKYELLVVPGFDISDVEKVWPFVAVSQAGDYFTLRSIVYGRSEIATRIKSTLETPEGYKSSYSGTGKYLGSKPSVYARYSYKSSDKFQVGLIAEKDAGEPFFDGTFNTGFDYLSGYVLINKLGKVKRLIVGDYHAEFGQGLTFWNNLSFGKSLGVVSGHKRANGLVKHSSAYESEYLRGVGGTIGIGKFDITAFGSYRKIDAAISDTLEDGEFAFTSLPETGYHRSISEIDNRNNLDELVAGTNVTLNSRRVKTSVTYVRSKVFGENQKSLALYQPFPQSYDKNVVGLSSDAYIRSSNIFGEVALQLNDLRVASLVGGSFRLSNTVQLGIIGRSYNRFFNSRYTAGFSEGSGVANENGIYTAITVLPAKGWKITGYVDVFSFPWLKYRVNSPSTGRELAAQTEYTVNANFDITVRYRYKQTLQNYSESVSQIIPVIEEVNHRLRLEMNYAPLEILRLKTLLEGVKFETDSTKREYGSLIAQDFFVKFRKIPLELSARIAVFDTYSWDTRIYSYESDMLYSFTVPAYYLQGTRVYLLLKYSPTKRLDCWLRYAQTRYANVDGIGQGADYIQGNTRSEIKAMVRVRF